MDVSNTILERKERSRHSISMAVLVHILLIWIMPFAYADVKATAKLSNAPATASDFIAISNNHNFAFAVDLRSIVSICHR